MDKKWDKRFMDVAELISTWSTCYKENRQVGAVIVKNNRIIALGYNGSPEKIKNCKERNECMRIKLGIESGCRSELCYNIHAEQNAILQAARMGMGTIGATIYVTHRPCATCTKMIINAGITRIVYKNEYPDSFALELIKEAGVTIQKFK